ncbi:uncharacterized protein LOC141712473 [Apium graveolens]|uniref:uncharacterized protein LOC141712473 n=1 Tax=Apium graveolens TaxID=4045 RepID=UPI003D7AFAA6
MLQNVEVQVSVPVPKPRANESKSETLKKRLDISKNQVDRFSRVVAPSGLLNGLNPRIINNVRKSRQVRSKMEALVSFARYKDIPSLKQSLSAAMSLQNVSSLSNEESSNQATVSTFSLKAANVASEWLELLHQDIKGRLTSIL